MAINDYSRREFLVGGLVAAGALLVPASALAGEPLVLVVGPQSKIRGISSSELKRIFLNRPTPSDDGVPFTPLNQKGGTGARARFDEAVLGMSPDEVKRYWIDQKIRGMKPPRTVPSSAVPPVLKQVPGAICYVPASHAKGLRAVSIDGKKPGSGGYPLG